MRAIVQRSGPASVSVDGTIVGKIDAGMVVLLGVGHEDTEKQAEKLASKIARLRIFPDDDGVANLSLLDTGLQALVISQFTLMADTRKGNRPSFIGAAPPEHAERLYELFTATLREFLEGDSVATGTFGAMMDVSLTNQGPYTLILETNAP